MSVYIDKTAAEAHAQWLQLLQIWLLGGVRAVVNMARHCTGPMVVAMTPELGYTTADKGRILGAFSAGYMLTQILGGICADRFGAKPILLLAVVSVSISLLLFPLAADLGLSYLLWLLWAAGFMCGPVFPSMQVMTSKWTSGGLNSYASAVSGAGTTAGSLLALGLTPPLATSLGWRMGSAVLGCAGLLFSAIWLLRARSAPGDAATASKASADTAHPDGTWPQLLRCWIRILLAPPVLAIFLVHSSQVAVRTFLVSWMPTYYSEELNVTSESTAVYLVLPEILGMVASLAGGRIARNMEQSGFSPLACRRLFLSLGTVGMGLGLMTVTRMRTATSATAILCLTQVFSNLLSVGFNANYLDVCKYSHGLVSGVGNSLATFASYLGPIVTASVLDGAASDRQGRWNLVLLIFSATSFTALAVYIPFASVVPVDLWARKAGKDDRTS